VPLEASVPEELREAPLGAEHLAACMALDQACFAGLWSETHWLRELEELWGCTAKRALSSLFGLWGRREHFVYKLVTAAEDQDVLFQGPKRTRRPCEGLQDHILPI
jgi:hypothetical protein